MISTSTATEFQHGTGHRRELFHTCLHEYMHTLVDPSFEAYADTLDDTRRHTLVEGFCDFFTDNVRAGMVVDEAVQAKIEGNYFVSGAPPPSGIAIGSYPSRQQAEQVVSVVGIKNAQEAYFKGDVARIGGT